MFDHEPLNPKKSRDYTGIKIAAFLAPLLLLFIYFGKADMGLTVFLVLGVIVFAIRTHRNLKKYLWFWAIIVLISVLHVPLFLMIRWPHGEVPGVFYGIPFAYADYLIIAKALDLAEKHLSKHSS